MQIELKEVAIRDIVSGYKNDEEDGVYGYNGLLNKNINSLYQTFLFPK